MKWWRPFVLKLNSGVTQIQFNLKPYILEEVHRPVLSIVQLERILKTIKEYHKSNPSAEITLEVNPDDLDLDYLDRIRALGVNRLSIGIQSFHSSHLSWMNRSHTSKQATNAIKWAKEKGF